MATTKKKDRFTPTSYRKPDPLPIEILQKVYETIVLHGGHDVVEAFFDSKDLERLEEK